jgi:hypothetical protein
LSLDKSGYPIDVFAEDEFDLAALVDLDGDGVLEIVGKPSLSQCGGCDTCSYDPFAVYRLPKPPIRKATYNLALSRKYNLEHYVWAGTRMSEGIDVNTCNPDKPHLGPARSR